MRLRPGTSDSQTYHDVTEGRYHVPPDWMPEPATVLDLGANIGLTCADYARMWPRAMITGVEMDAENAKVARENADPTTTILVGAVVADLYDRRGYDPTMATEAYALGTGIMRPVQRFSLGHLARRARYEASADAVDFCKMDVEGEEWRLLEHAEWWAPWIRHLLVELHGTDDLNERVLRGVGLLRHCGYDCEPSTHPSGLFAWRT